MSKIRFNHHWVDWKLIVSISAVILLLVLLCLCGCVETKLPDEYIFGKVGNVELDHYDESVFYPVIYFVGGTRREGIYIPYDNYLEWEDEIRESFDAPKLYRFQCTTKGMGPIYSIISVD